MYPDPESVSYSAPLEQSSDSHVISAFVKTEFLSAPLPPPNIMKGYDDIIPNGAERIMQMAEKEQDSQITERTETRKDNKEIAFKKINLIKRGQYMGYSLAVILMGLLFSPDMRMPPCSYLALEESPLWDCLSNQQKRSNKNVSQV